MFALSLSWNNNKFRSAERQIEEVNKAGFRAIELNFSLTEKKLSQISNLFKNGKIKVLSCHNFCPIPKGLSVKQALPDYYSLSSLNDKKRRLALKYSKISVDIAARLKAKVVIFHCGRVEMPDASKQLMRLFAAGKKDSPLFKDLASRMQREREKTKKAFLEKAGLSIKELSAYAKKRGVKVALENRVYYPEIPQLEEVENLLNETGAFFWFDTGHACIMEKLWQVSLLEYLKRYSSRLIGVHLHDVAGMQDHLVPGTGEFNFRSLRPYINAKTIKVIEAHFPATSQELTRSISFLNKALN